ncbi:unnamed protein product [Phytophthora lilii]|uniref:Unnamed protein product n=1 Tax=Phytophthora lilii TaxID=2077276 RepID=A0A9W6TJ74_9STRA|nr:unnamed protein product [Phytophthora lilii]
MSRAVKAADFNSGATISVFAVMAAHLTIAAGSVWAPDSGRKCVASQRFGRRLQEHQVVSEVLDVLNEPQHDVTLTSQSNEVVYLLVEVYNDTLA